MAASVTPRQRIKSTEVTPLSAPNTRTSGARMVGHSLIPTAAGSAARHRPMSCASVLVWAPGFPAVAPGVAGGGVRMPVAWGALGPAPPTAVVTTLPPFPCPPCGGVLAAAWGGWPGARRVPPVPEPVPVLEQRRHVFAAIVQVPGRARKCALPCRCGVNKLHCCPRTHFSCLVVGTAPGTGTRQLGPHRRSVRPELTSTVPQTTTMSVGRAMAALTRRAASAPCQKKEKKRKKDDRKQKLRVSKTNPSDFCDIFSNGGITTNN